MSICGILEGVLRKYVICRIFEEFRGVIVRVGQIQYQRERGRGRERARAREKA